MATLVPLIQQVLLRRGAKGRAEGDEILLGLGRGVQRLQRRRLQKRLAVLVQVNVRLARHRGKLVANCAQLTDDLRRQTRDWHRVATASFKNRTDRAENRHAGNHVSVKKWVRRDNTFGK